MLPLYINICTKIFTLFVYRTKIPFNRSYDGETMYVDRERNNKKKVEQVVEHQRKEKRKQKKKKRRRRKSPDGEERIYQREAKVESQRILRM